MSSSITIHSHKAVILTFCHFDHTVEISSLKKRVENELMLSLPMLTTEGTIGELHIVRSLDMVVWKSKRTIVPGVVSVLKPRTKINDFSTRLRRTEASSDQHIVAFCFEYDGNWLRKV